MSDQTSPLSVSNTDGAVVAAPVTGSARVKTVDVLRGVALLGILVINIEGFALPSAAMFNPTIAGGMDGINLVTNYITSTLFLSKMMAIFSMLFGGGLVLMYERFEVSGRSFGGIYYRRILWLLVIALIHAYLIWFGDILFTYAMVGLLLFLFRRKTPRTLIILGAAVLLVGMLVQMGSGFMFGALRSAHDDVQQIQAEGGTPPGYKIGMAKAWEETRVLMEPSQEKLDQEIAAYRGGYMDNLEKRAQASLEMQVQAFPFWTLWRAGGLMLLGMALMKLGVFSATRSRRFYVIMGIAGYAIGLPLVLYSVTDSVGSGFDMVRTWKYAMNFQYIGSIPVALGHVAVVMLICKAGLWKGLQRWLAAVGQMALTNYLLQSVVGTTIFKCPQESPIAKSSLVTSETMWPFIVCVTLHIISLGIAAS